MAYNIGDDELQDLRDAIDSLEAASQIPAKSRAAKIFPTVDEICEHVYQFGYPNEELQRVIELITVKTELDQSTTTALIKNLYPANRVPANVVVSIVGCLGHGKKNPSASTQAALVRWLVAAHEVLEDHSIVLRFYAVLFNLLDMITIRTPLCQLLALITRRKHVRPFRINRLLELSQQAGNEPALMGLLRVYKNFCPDIAIGSSGSTRSSSLSQSDPEWRKRLLAIQDAAATYSAGAHGGGGFKIARNGAKRSKISVLPEVHTFHASEAVVTLEDIDNVDHFVDKLEYIEPPSQIVAGLRDPLLQKFLLLGSSDDSTKRLEFWLLRYFEEELEALREGFGLSPTLPDILSALVSYSESSKTLLPITQQFLATYMPMWNGVSDLGTILDLMAFLPSQPFADVHRIMLAPLEQSILQTAHFPFDTLFEFYTSLAQRWISFMEPTSTHRQAYVDMLEHVSILAQSALAANQSAKSAILSFYERVSDCAKDNISKGDDHIDMGLPPHHVLYPLLMSPSTNILSRVCALLVTYKQSFEKQMKSSGIYKAETTKTLNGYLMDVCNLLWRSRALVSSDANSFGCLCPEEITSGLQSYVGTVDHEYSVAVIFGFSHNPLISALSRSAFISLEDEAEANAGESLRRHAGPVTQRSLTLISSEGGIAMTWKQYRIAILDWLAARGVEGIKTLMFATMKDLMKR